MEMELCILFIFYNNFNCKLPPIFLFIYFWLHRVIIAVPGLSLEAVCGLLAEVASLVEHWLELGFSSCGAPD